MAKVRRFRGQRPLNPTPNIFRRWVGDPVVGDVIEVDGLGRRRVVINWEKQQCDGWGSWDGTDSGPPDKHEDAHYIEKGQLCIDLHTEDDWIDGSSSRACLRCAGVDVPTEPTP